MGLGAINNRIGNINHYFNSAIIEIIKAAKTMIFGIKMENALDEIIEAKTSTAKTV